MWEGEDDKKQNKKFSDGHWERPREKGVAMVNVHLILYYARQMLYILEH